MSSSQFATHQDAAPAPPDNNAANPPRKRRKRAPAAGAAVDCFTCTSRSVNCDRRRPYCSRCLDDGKDCAGYKTQLTWGNGVASRGKLRGLSLPIAGTQKLPQSGSPPRPKKRPLLPPSSPRPPQLQHILNAAPEIHPVPSPAVRDPDSTTNGNAPFRFGLSHPPPVPPSYPTTTGSWSPQPELPSVKIEPSVSSYPASSWAPSVVHGASTGASLRRPSAAYSGSDRVSPMSYSAPSPESAYFTRVLNHTTTGMPATLPPYPDSPQLASPFGGSFPDHRQFHIYQRQDDDIFHNESPAQSLLPQKVEASHVQNIDEAVDEEVEEVPRLKFENECAIVEDDSAIGFPQWSLHNDSLSLSPFAGFTAIGATPRIQYLIQYYTEVISPVIVAFDGPSNPYRTQILRLAGRSETLQHAIAALAASNLRQRRETGLSTGKTDPARRSSMAHLTLTQEEWHETGLLTPQEQAREESLHKGIAIQSLNMQLANPLQRMDDSILATLLILCLFHICDSGVAKFRTQFAGVKKLLALRKNDPGLNTREAKWFTRMFTWFDAMTATVNDREGQLQGYHLDVSALSDEEWALENLAGCDGNLFKVIAKLGRLNVLSQGRSVEESPAIVSRPLPTMPSVLNFDYSKFDGNGWMRIAEDEELFSSKVTEPDVKTQFWREWREIRQALLSWQLDTTVLDRPTPGAPYLTDEQRIDLGNISESFRYSALLYTERLAHPRAPSTEPAIRGWVRECLKYIKAVKSDVYLLWPLFITGSECVDDLDREVIRQRCLDIQKDSGFLNNKSCLELLEKVWRAYDDKKKQSEHAESDGHADNETGFRFTTIMKMESNEGEYIVV
ncbi:uncharacterized protein Z520_11415 [Fonsecaea multimorphosa CBS 102226]|uniref:Zn(2)-C6 fungal-type domain-containing protein n=1 Tax=Fonsecaea multimorphosa CBS 102226 TaxID=1442371 RepID=A0A0D2JR61_9EURO|nr:uncharacterized protein Z520_11415 [Fonsecaea multimorphosa CBS 102226]KIX92939.1 hypothetical protein Z520_11415 [Fonsecaea multimorphosa CBS 102226]OAL18187.1 hypothetical protein AYO22_10964 [Fonsecaea multimorphosa]